MAAERRAPQDVGAAGVLAGVGVVLGAIALSLLAAWTLLSASGGGLRARAAQRPEVPAPALEANPHVDRLAYDKSEQRKLSEYGWVDRNRGTVRIPVSSAMQLLSERAGVSTGTRP